jgi:hypothetical protein
MKSIQPCSAEKPVGHPDRGLQNTLEDIHNLARHDRVLSLRAKLSAAMKSDKCILSCRCVW